VAVKQLVARYAVLGAGALLMLIGALLLAFRPGVGMPALGWSAYAPLNRVAFVPGASPGPWMPVALILVVIGFCAVVAWIGFQIGRSRAS
jgi:hypothetical protein